MEKGKISNIITWIVSLILSIGIMIATCRILSLKNIVTVLIGLVLAGVIVIGLMQETGGKENEE